MKRKYVVLLVVFGIFAFLFEVLVFWSPFGEHPRLANAIQSAGMFVALLAAIIGLSAADRRRKRIKVRISRDLESRREHHHKDMDASLEHEFFHYPDPVVSWQVHFNIVNESGFTLEKPVVTFRVPNQKKHPHRSRDDEPWSRRTLNSNLYNSRDELRTLEFADTSLISNSNLAYWNPGEVVALWIRMVLDDGQDDAFDVSVSVNCLNADGYTQRVVIDPKKLVTSLPPAES